MTQGTERGRRRRGRGDEGAALVEFAFVGVLLFTLVFGIISFGLLLSFKQDMTRAAAEGARAGAVAVADGNPPGETQIAAALSAAQTATEEAVEGFGGSFDGSGCAHVGMDCGEEAIGDGLIEVVPCPEDTSKQCVTVTLVYDYGDHPLYGNIPLISQFLPDEVRSSSVARINE
jgi:hypothetical protein